MKRNTKLALCALGILGFAGVFDLPAAAQMIQPETAVRGSGKRMVGYFTDWAIYSGYYPKNLVVNGSAGKLTHILYAFANVPEPGQPGAGTCQLGDSWADYEMGVDASNSVDGIADGGWGTLRGNFNQLLKLKAKYPNVKLLISVGGWTFSGGFSAAASTDASRKALVASCVDMFIRGNFVDPANYNVTQPGLFDGIDIDWEYPGACGNTCNETPEDPANFVLLMKEFRKQLDAEGAKNKKHYLLSAAIPTGGTAANYNLTESSKPMDFVNLMGYDIHGGWDDHADHGAPLFTSPFDPLPGDKTANVNSAVEDQLRWGVPPCKINVGVPFYGHGWMTTSGARNGLYQPASGVSPNDQASYAKLKTLTGVFHYYDPLSGGAHWIFNPLTHEFNSYDDPAVMAVKAGYIRFRGLGGAMFWELSQDDANGSLVKALHSVLR